MPNDPLVDRMRLALTKAAAIREKHDRAVEAARVTGILLRNAEAELATATAALRAAEEQAEAEQRAARMRAADEDDTGLDWQHR